MDSKTLATNAHVILKEMGHEIPLGHVYELFSKLSGYQSWNVAKTKNGFVPIMTQLDIPNTTDIINTSDKSYAVSWEDFLAAAKKLGIEELVCKDDYIRLLRGDEDIIEIFTNYHVLLNKSNITSKESSELLLTEIYGDIISGEFIYYSGEEMVNMWLKSIAAHANSDWSTTNDKLTEIDFFIKTNKMLHRVKALLKEKYSYDLDFFDYIA